MRIPGAFRDIAPKWAAALSAAKTVKEVVGYTDAKGNSNDPTDGGISLTQFNKCVVGEAYLFAEEVGNGDYGCNECGIISNTFGRIINGDQDDKGNRKQMLEKQLITFTKHWRSKHIEQQTEIATTEEEPVVQTTHSRRR